LGWPARLFRANAGAKPAATGATGTTGATGESPPRDVRVAQPEGPRRCASGGWQKFKSLAGRCVAALTPRCFRRCTATEKSAADSAPKTDSNIEAADALRKLGAHKEDPDFLPWVLNNLPGGKQHRAVVFKEMGIPERTRRIISRLLKECAPDAALTIAARVTHSHAQMRERAQGLLACLGARSQDPEQVEHFMDMLVELQKSPGDAAATERAKKACAALQFPDPDAAEKLVDSVRVLLRAETELKGPVSIPARGYEGKLQAYLQMYVRVLDALAGIGDSKSAARETQ
jgi:hypothetical protein